MKKIDISSDKAIAETLPSAGKTVKFYDKYGRSFKGCVEFNQWFRPIFYQLIWANDRVRLSWVPIGWDELETTGNADEDAGAYADMPAMKEAA